MQDEHVHKPGTLRCPLCEAGVPLVPLKERQSVTIRDQRTGIYFHLPVNVYEKIKAAVEAMPRSKYRYRRRK